MKTVGNEGVTGLWVGLPTYIVRIAPHVMIVSIIRLILIPIFRL